MRHAEARRLPSTPSPIPHRNEEEWSLAQETPGLGLTKGRRFPGLRSLERGNLAEAIPVLCRAGYLETNEGTRMELKATISQASQTHQPKTPFRYAIFTLASVLLAVGNKDIGDFEGNLELLQARGRVEL